MKHNPRLATSVTDFNTNKTIHKSMLIPTFPNEDLSPSKTQFRSQTKVSNFIFPTTTTSEKKTNIQSEQPLPIESPQKEEVDLQIQKL